MAKPTPPKETPNYTHPYMQYEGSPLWNVIDRTIDDLVENGDMVETTGRVYIVGYLCKKISKSRKIKEAMANHETAPIQ